VVAAYGFPVFFALTAAIGIPVVILCLLVGKVPARRTSAGESPPESAAAEAKPA
jgi:PAT family beta-lactamase induction signal transducer AmpG